MSADVSICPKCRAPRSEGAQECPVCGVLYDRVKTAPPPVATPATPYDPPRAELQVENATAPPAVAPPARPELVVDLVGRPITRTMIRSLVAARPSVATLATSLLGLAFLMGALIVIQDMASKAAGGGVTPARMASNWVRAGITAIPAWLGFQLFLFRSALGELEREPNEESLENALSAQHSFLRAAALLVLLGAGLVAYGLLRFAAVGARS